MSASPTTTQGDESSRSRNAQAQADLRARRKAYLAEMEVNNSNLTRHNEKLLSEREYLHDQINTLKGQVKTLKDTLGMRNTAANGIDSLLATVETERNKVKRLRCAIKKLAALEAQDSDSESEEREAEGSSRKRSKVATTPFIVDLSTPLAQPKVDISMYPHHYDVESSTSLTSSSLSPPTPPQSEAFTPVGHWTSKQQQQQRQQQQQQQQLEEDDESSRSALTLLLAQSMQFKQQVVYALADDIQKGGSNSNSLSTLPTTAFSDWPQWQSSPGDSNKQSSKTPIHSTAQVDHDDVLRRLLSSFSTNHSATSPNSTISGASSTDISAAMLSQANVPDRPLQSHLPLASVFLVFCRSVLRGVVEMLMRESGGMVEGLIGCRTLAVAES